MSDYAQQAEVEMWDAVASQDTAWERRQRQLVDERPVHRPLCPDPPIPGGPHHYAGCDPDGARVDATGVCEGCGGLACPECGFEVCDCS